MLNPIKWLSARWPKINGRVVVPFRFKPGAFDGDQTRVIDKAVEEYNEK